MRGVPVSRVGMSELRDAKELRGKGIVEHPRPESKEKHPPGMEPGRVEKKGVHGRSGDFVLIRFVDSRIDEGPAQTSHGIVRDEAEDADARCTECEEDARGRVHHNECCDRDGNEALHPGSGTAGRGGWCHDDLRSKKGTTQNPCAQ